MNKLLITLLLLSGLFSCTQKEAQHLADIENWQLSWRMMSSTMDNNLELAESQFDSILNQGGQLDVKILSAGLGVKASFEKEDEITTILSQIDKDQLSVLCPNESLVNLEICKSFVDPEPENKEIQLELIQMYFNDQASRGNIMDELVDKYDIDKTNAEQLSAIVEDEKNRNRLKEIIAEFGFPTRKLVGKEAMKGVFLMIQHSDGDKVWQKSQLSNIKLAVEKGDMDGQSYAYLYDRIKVNAGEKQLYGTQFSNVDPINKIAEFAELEDPENLDIRRMEVGMMPSSMYQKFMLKNI